MSCCFGRISLLLASSIFTVKLKCILNFSIYQQVLLSFIFSNIYQSGAVSAIDLIENRKVCLKIIKNDKDFFDQSLDEIKLLKFLEWNVRTRIKKYKNGLDDVHILQLYDFFYYKEHLILVTELLQGNSISIWLTLDVHELFVLH